MIKPIVLGLGVALSFGIAAAQPAPSPTPSPAGPTTGKPGDAPPDKKKGTDEKAGNDESLQNGGDTRPWAAGVPADKQKAALKKFQEGNVQLNQGFFSDAAKLYREALTMWDHPAINYNLALALMNLDQPIEVYDSLEKAIKFGTAPLEKDKFDHAKEYMLLVEKQLATVEVSCDKVGAKVSVDGKEVFTVAQGQVGHYKGRVKVGKHTFVAEKPGYNAQVDAPYVEPGQNFRIELKLYTSEELRRYKRKWSKVWLPYTVLGGGAAVALIGGIFELSAKSSYSDYDSAVARCNDASMQMGCTSTSVSDMRSSGDTKRTLGYIGYGLGFAAIATGAVMVYMNRTSPYEITADQYKAELRAKGTVGVAPLVAPDAGGAMVFGTF